MKRLDYDHEDPVEQRRHTPLRVLVAPAPPFATISEAAFQRLVEDLAEFWGWRKFHDHDSRQNAAGLPDLLLVRPPVLIFAELKTMRGRLRLEQNRWAGDLLRCPGVTYRLWRPQDWLRILQDLAPPEHDVIATGKFTVPRVPLVEKIVPHPPRTVRSGPKHRRKSPVQRSD
jgi:hypothetical protein